MILRNRIPDGFVDYRGLSAFCDDYLKDVNDLGAYADIDRNGSVDVGDFNDLGALTNEWLWDADDPTSW